MAIDGVPEEWRSVEGWPYEVSNLGRVRRAGAPGRAARVGRIKKASVGAQGYLEVSLCQPSPSRQRTATVHELVCVAFHGPRPGPGYECRHLNGDRTDPRASNLAWGTYAEQWSDQDVHGTKAQGEKHYARMLTESQIRDIRAAHRIAKGSRGAVPKGTLDRIAEQYGISKGALRNITGGANWKHVR
jgi:hypothetical protein